VIVQPDGRALGELAELVATGKLEVSIAATFPLEEAAEAFAAGTGGGAGGAVVLRPDGGEDLARGIEWRPRSSTTAPHGRAGLRPDQEQPARGAPSARHR
jgi:hypothetical protein